MMLAKQLAQVLAISTGQHGSSGLMPLVGNRSLPVRGEVGVVRNTFPWEDVNRYIGWVLIEMGLLS